MRKVIIRTEKPKQVIDITDKVVKERRATDGFCHVFAAHTTVALTLADLDPGTDLDMLDAFRELIPKLAYRHPHDPSHVPDHILSALIGTSISVPIAGGELLLGTWQRIVLVEFAGPRERTVYIE